jgi:hypothetical protein
LIEIINVDEIEKSKMDFLTFSGVPEASLRPIVWRILMDSLPLKPAEWEKQMDENLQTYENFKKDLIVNP